MTSSMLTLLFIISSFLGGCVTIHNYPNQQAPSFFPGEEPYGTEHTKLKKVYY